MGTDAFASQRGPTETRPWIDPGGTYRKFIFPHVPANAF
jgi:hypothetical protein